MRAAWAWTGACKTLLFMAGGEGVGGEPAVWARAVRVGDEGGEGGGGKVGRWGAARAVRAVGAV